MTIDGGRVCKCGRRTIEGNCFGCGLPPRKCECPTRTVSAFLTLEEATRLLTTNRPRVVPSPNAAMHIDGGNGKTLCGYTIEAIHGRPTGTGPQRISCIRIAEIGLGL